MDIQNKQLQIQTMMNEAKMAMQHVNVIWGRGVPGTVQDAQNLEDTILDARDQLSALITELVYLRAHLEASGKGVERDSQGNIIVSISANTAPCSEVAESLGVSTAKIVSMARRLGLNAAGTVEWELADGGRVTSNTYNIEQWRLLKTELERQGQLWEKGKGTPPARLTRG